MALIYKGITCAICDQVIDKALLDSDEFVATSHFIHDSASPLWEFSDAAMHRSCFLEWPLRAEFVRAYNEAMKGDDDPHGWHWHMNEDGEIVRHSDEGEVVAVDEEAEEESLMNYLDSIGALQPDEPEK